MYVKTLKSPFTVEGIGLHTGKLGAVNITPSDSGKVIFVIDGKKVEAVADNVINTRRSTAIGIDDNTKIGTVEHLLAALYLSQVGSVEIEIVEGKEIPILGGSAKEWYEKIQEVGTKDTGILKKAPVVIEKPEYIINEGSEIILLPAKDDGLNMYYGISIKDTFIDSMIVGGDIFDDNVIKNMVQARTYGLESEVKALIEAGLALGGSMDNAVIIGKDNYINTDVKENEPAWHKLLDLVGDLSLAGVSIKGEIIVLRGGHRCHVNLAKKIYDLKSKGAKESC